MAIGMMHRTASMLNGTDSIRPRARLVLIALGLLLTCAASIASARRRTRPAA